MNNACLLQIITVSAPMVAIHRGWSYIETCKDTFEVVVMKGSEFDVTLGSDWVPGKMCIERNRFLDQTIDDDANLKFMSFDLLIGADGLNSNVREDFYPIGTMSDDTPQLLYLPSDDARRLPVDPKTVSRKPGKLRHCVSLSP
jgi:hypothetical protein